MRQGNWEGGPTRGQAILSKAPQVGGLTPKPYYLKGHCQKSDSLNVKDGAQCGEPRPKRTIRIRKHAHFNAQCVIRTYDSPTFKHPPRDVP